ncbi:MAG: sbcC [Micrococcaceae bacterium]|nr:sbcC [Micrococcaceae bacterium]
MRIHRLEIQAFGPFAERQVIDFDELGSAGLFLLNGATGAGKTSVLDAICFALYGSVPGARQTGKRLRSDHAAPHLAPQVLCEFSARNRRLEVLRSPAWERPAKRGGGTTTEKASIQLREKDDGVWTAKSSRNDEAGGEITALLGMDMEQFTKVVLLAQGDFAAFLRSKADDRQELLQKLFGTDLYRKVERQLQAEAATVRTGLVEQEAELERLRTAALAHAHGLTEPALDEAPLSASETFNRLLAVLAELYGSAAKQVTAGREEAASASAAVDAARQLAARHQALDAALQEQERLTAQGEDIGQWQQKLSAHRSAQVLAGRLDAVNEAETAHRQAVADVQESLALLLSDAGAAAVAGSGSADDTAVSDGASGSAKIPVSGGASGSGQAADEDWPLERLESVRDRVEAQRAVVEAALPDEQRLSKLRDRLADDAANLAAERLTQANVHDARQAAVELLDALTSEEAALRGPAGQLEQLRGEVAAATALLETIRTYQRTTDRLPAVEQECLKAGRQAIQAERGWLELMRLRLEGAAAEMAAKLVPGEPCSVCGSPEHPEPAIPTGTLLVAAEDEEAAKQAADTAKDLEAKATARLAQVQQEVAVLRAQGGAEDVELADQRRAAATASLRSAQQAKERLTEVETGILTARANLKELETREESAGRNVAQLETTLGTLTAAEHELDARLQAFRRGYASLQDRLHELTGTSRLLREAAGAARRELHTGENLHAAGAALEAALPGSGFRSTAEAFAAVLPEPEERRATVLLRDHDQALARNQASFDQPAVQQAHQERAAGTTAPGELALAQLDEAAATARHALEQAVVYHQVVERALAAVSSFAEQHAELEARTAPLRERARQVAAIADTARGAGENTYKMSLNAYVLAARLEQVAVAASERLATMSDGRYTLSHTDALAGRNQKSGLGLQVVDQWTGQRRDTATLSGGESFMASLALALGLADVVQQEAGGVDIETLFVDEGFGSLDEQSLEQVMNALEGLRDGGRVVGLVSHVPEMKLRIPTQLHVHKGRTGSTVSLHTAAAALV